MLRELIQIWRKQDMMTKVVEAFGQMLQDDVFVFSNAWEAVSGRQPYEKLKQPIHDRDKNVNRREREIRKMLVEHLSLNPGKDVSGCLIMMSLIKDAERIGDYSKNIFDVGSVLKGHAGQTQHFKTLSQIQIKLMEHLTQLATAFPAGDQVAAEALLEDYASLKNSCSKVLEAVFESDLPAREAVSIALLSRFLKRINSHICNIASGLVYPIDRIDFVRGGITD